MLTFVTSVTKNWFRNVNLNFIGNRKVGYVISILLSVIGIISLFTRGLDQGIDFVGGRTYQVRFEKEVVPTQVAEALKKDLGNVEVKTFGAPNQVKISTKYKVQEESTYKNGMKNGITRYNNSSTKACNLSYLKGFLTKVLHKLPLLIRWVLCNQ